VISSGRSFFESAGSESRDFPRAVDALVFIRTLSAVEREVKGHREKLGGTFTTPTWRG
jgi:hypothetical protein